MSTSIYSILIVEDEAEVRQRLVETIDSHPDFQLVAECASEADGIRELLARRPDVLLTDLGLPDGSGINIIKAIQQNQLDCEAMVITGFQDEHHVFSALAAGARGYIYKYDDEQSVTGGILAMLNGGAPISPVIARLVLDKFRPETTPTPEHPESLTERQLKILKMVSQGFSSKEIAQKLDISYYTVTTHIKNIYSKLQVNSRTEALHEAVKLGLLE